MTGGNENCQTLVWICRGGITQSSFSPGTHLSSPLCPLPIDYSYREPCEFPHTSCYFTPLCPPTPAQNLPSLKSISELTPHPPIILPQFWISPVSLSLHSYTARSMAYMHMLLSYQDINPLHSMCSTPYYLTQSKFTSEASLGRSSVVDSLD